jgi:hypothetical protein
VPSPVKRDARAVSFWGARSHFSACLARCGKYEGSKMGASRARRRGPAPVPRQNQPFPSNWRQRFGYLRALRAVGCIFGRVLLHPAVPVLALRCRAPTGPQSGALGPRLARALASPRKGSVRARRRLPRQADAGEPCTPHDEASRVVRKLIGGEASLRCSGALRARAATDRALAFPGGYAGPLGPLCGALPRPRASRHPARTTSR